MNDPVLDELERKERLAFARVVFVAKMITWTALLLLALIIEAALVIKVFKIEFGPTSVHASTSEVPPTCACSRTQGRGCRMNTPDGDP